MPTIREIRDYGPPEFTDVERTLATLAEGELFAVLDRLPLRLRNIVAADVSAMMDVEAEEAGLGAPASA